MSIVLLSIPSPPISSFQLGPFTLHIYALTMIAGMLAAYVVGGRRWRARGGRTETFESIVLWAIPCGIVGARIYHVATHWEDYIGPGINPLSVFFIWEGGIAMFGSLIGGAVGALIGARRAGASLWAFGDAIAPGIALAQAVGRLGNWFNQELFGGPTNLPWGLEIDPNHRPPGYEQFETFHPTFAYEALLNILSALVLIRLDRWLRLGHGQVFALYVSFYGLIRFFIEGMRTDFSYYIGPLRTNQVAALVVGVGGAVAFALLRRFRPGREERVERAG